MGRARSFHIHRKVVVQIDTFKMHKIVIKFQLDTVACQTFVKKRVDNS